MLSPPTLSDFTDARARISPPIHRTPVERSTALGAQIGAELYLKCENLQKTGSFKARGALNKLMQLDKEARQRGVVTVSAGNHAQALAWAAGVEETPCTVVMPANASKIKVEATEGYGARVILHGSVHEVFDRAHELERDQGLTFIHPFDDAQIIAGAGTMGLEILEQIPNTTTVVAPIGGGGQIAGVSAAIKLQRPDIKVYGVEPEGAPSMHRSLAAGHAVQLENISTIADGLSPPMAGKLNYEYVKEYVDEVVLVTDTEILEALRSILSRTKLLVEPSGAATVAALLAGRIPIAPTDQITAILSGGNISLEQLKILLNP